MAVYWFLLVLLLGVASAAENLRTGHEEGAEVTVFGKISVASADDIVEDSTLDAKDWSLKKVPDVVAGNAAAESQRVFVVLPVTRTSRDAEPPASPAAAAPASPSNRTSTSASSVATTKLQPADSGSKKYFPTQPKSAGPLTTPSTQDTSSFKPGSSSATQEEEEKPAKPSAKLLQFLKNNSKPRGRKGGVSPVVVEAKTQKPVSMGKVEKTSTGHESVEVDVSLSASEPPPPAISSSFPRGSRIVIMPRPHVLSGFVPALPPPMRLGRSACAQPGPCNPRDIMVAFAKVAANNTLAAPLPTPATQMPQGRPSLISRISQRKPAPLPGSRHAPNVAGGDQDAVEANPSTRPVLLSRLAPKRLPSSTTTITPVTEVTDSASESTTMSSSTIPTRSPLLKRVNRFRGQKVKVTTEQMISTPISTTSLPIE